MPGGGALGASAAGVTLTGIRSGAWFAVLFLILKDPVGDPSHFPTRFARPKVRRWIREDYHQAVMSKAANNLDVHQRIFAGVGCRHDLRVQ
jgi:hypothetical protein